MVILFGKADTERRALPTEGGLRDGSLNNQVDRASLRTKKTILIFIEDLSRNSVFWDSRESLQVN